MSRTLNIDFYKLTLSEDSNISFEVILQKVISFLGALGVLAVACGTPFGFAVACGAKPSCNTGLTSCSAASPLRVYVQKIILIIHLAEALLDFANLEDLITWLNKSLFIK